MRAPTEHSRGLCEPMKITIAPDSFKESLTAVQAADAIARGLRRALPHSELVCAPMADGGEGTVEALVVATGGRFLTARVTGPLGETLEAPYGVLGDGETAVIEMAAASGLPLVPPDRRNPLVTTTYGTGELIRAALDAGARKILVGVGGSATTDGGAGMAEALGAKLLNASGRSIARGGGALTHLARIDVSCLDERLKRTKILVASDVTNPLCGERGAARVYGPQKGATPAMVEQLDRALAHFAAIIRRDLGADVLHVPGAGAAGGLGAGLIAFLDATIRPGIELVIDAVRLRKRMAGSHWVITGEGQIDGSSAFGKTATGVASVARSLGIPVIALAGAIGDGAEAVHEHGIDAFFSITPRPMTQAEAFAKAASLLEDEAAEIGRLIAIPPSQSLKP